MKLKCILLDVSKSVKKCSPAKVISMEEESKEEWATHSFAHVVYCLVSNREGLGTSL